ARGSSSLDFALPGVDGQIHKLNDYSTSPVLAIVFTCNHCSTSQLYERRLQKLYEDYRGKGVTLIAINPNNPAAVQVSDLRYTDVGDSLADMKARAAHRHFGYPYLYDGETQPTARAFRVSATPQVFVFDRDRKLRYEGRIDDNAAEPQVKTRDARDAIDALLAGRPVRVAHTRATGCDPAWLPESAARGETRKVDAESVGVEMASPEVLK